MRSAARDRLQLEKDLQRALERGGELSLHYQPILNLATGQLSGIEALARWRHPQLGPISPLRFVKLAEETRQIGDLGRWVLKRACADAVGWPSHVGVAVNVSPRQLAEGQFDQLLLRTLSRHHLQPRDLLLEITEGVFAEGEAAHAALAAIARIGVRLAIDDFGTGYSSLSYLRKFPIDAVKIDRSFITDIPGNESAAKLVETIVRMGQGLNKQVIAEGVETAQQARFLREIGCDSIQGYHVARPMPAERFAEWMAACRAAPPDEALEAG
jgi:EAL domain-containing protein (putative c-di-GMP-specific phosphodiesterase class I)